MEAQDGAIASKEGFVISQSLGTLEHAKGQFLGGEVNILHRVGCDLQEQAIIGATFVQLTGGMQETRSKANCGGTLRLRANGKAQITQCGLHRSAAPQVRVNGY